MTRSFVKYTQKQFVKNLLKKKDNLAKSSLSFKTLKQSLLAMI